VKDYVAQKCTYSIGFYAVIRPSVIGCEVISDKTNAVGIRVQDSEDGVLKNCKVREHRWGILVRSSDNITMSGAYIQFGGPGIPGAPPMSGISYGIDVGDQTSHMHVRDCEVKGTHYAVAVRNSTINCTVNHTTITKTNYTGVYLSSSKLEAWNIIITDTNESAVQSYSSVLNITNSSISNSNLYDLYLDQNSNITTLNTTFNKALVQYFDTESILTVRWFMHVHVVMPDLNPLEGDVTVKNVNNDIIFTGTSTAAEGTCRWIKCTEYIQSQAASIYYSSYNVTATVFSTVRWAMPEAPMERTSDVYVVFLGNGYNIYLHEGWNLISVPYEPYDMSSTNILEVLKPIEGKWNVVKWYDANDASDPWKTYRLGASTNDLSHINHTMGFWLKATEPCTLVAMGEKQEVPSTDIHLYTGWNLVGYPTDNNSVNISTALSGISEYRDRPVEGYDPESPTLLCQLPEDYIMQPGEAYWIHVNANCTWTVNW